MYDTVRWLIERERERERERVAKNISRFAIVVPLTLSVPPAQTLAKNHRRLRCNSCSILHHNNCGQVKPTKLKRQFQSIIISWICPRYVTSISPGYKIEATVNFHHEHFIDPNNCPWVSEDESNTVTWWNVCMELNMISFLISYNLPVSGTWPMLFTRLKFRFFKLANWIKRSECL